MNKESRSIRSRLEFTDDALILTNNPKTAVNGRFFINFGKKIFIFTNPSRTAVVKLPELAFDVAVAGNQLCGVVTGAVPVCFKSKFYFWQESKSDSSPCFLFPFVLPV